VIDRREVVDQSSSPRGRLSAQRSRRVRMAVPYPAHGSRRWTGAWSAGKRRRAAIEGRREGGVG